MTGAPTHPSSSAWREEAPFDELFEAVYADLKGLAHRRLRSERDDLTLCTTALVHEAYLRLLGSADYHWQDRHHFFAVASRLMRRILIDHARERAAVKRGGNVDRVPFRPEELVDLFAAESADPEALLALDEQLTRLAALHPRAARTIELRYFGGLTLQEVGETLGCSTATALRDARFALAWLAVALCDDG
jgi:RNA polymerase sigma factor (TIGR02999 family)